MTREEEINNVKNTFYERIFEEGSYYDPRDCFEEGAEWADENPRTPWINVNDSLPNDETKLYIIYCEAYNKNGDDIENNHYEIYLANFDKETSSWVNIESYNNYFFDVLYWMEIPELPKDVCDAISNLNSKHQ